MPNTTDITDEEQDDLTEKVATKVTKTLEEQRLRLCKTEEISAYRTCIDALKPLTIRN